MDKDNENLGSIFGYAKSKYEDRIEQKRRRRSHSEPGSGTPGRSRGPGKLHKPPKVRAVSEKPRNRLRKPVPLQPHVQEPTINVFVLEYEPYPHSIEPGQVLGVYSTFNSVTSGAFAHGAYTFSREGLLDGNEYLSPTGRIKLVKTTVQRTGVRAPVPERSDSPQGEQVRLDIPHPESQETNFAQAVQENDKHAARDTVCLAIRAGPQSASWIGVFADKSLAWGACLKDKAMCAVSGTLCDEVRTIGANNMPQVTGRLVGSGRFTWKVEEREIDESGHKPTATSRDV